MSGTTQRLTSALVVVLTMQFAAFVVIPHAEAIVNGDEVPGTDYPFAAHLLVAFPGIGEGNCSGALIAPEWVLTAAHCLEHDGANPAQDSITVTLGSSDWKQPAFQTKSASWFIPDGYSGAGRGKSWDVALVRLRDSAPPAHPPVRRATADEFASATGSEHIAIGYGASTYGEMDGNTKLRSAPMGRLHPWGLSFRADVAVRNKVPWSGDSGGPLLGRTTTGELIELGVFDWAGRRFPVVGAREFVYARITAPEIEEWIDTTIGLGEFANGSFESPVVSDVRTFEAGEVIDPWRVTFGSVDLTHDDHWVAADGSQSLDLNGCTPGRIAQTFRVQPGRPYVVSFSYSGNPDGDRGTKPFGLELDSVPLASFSFDTTSNSRENMGWTTGSVQFSSSAQTAELAFTSGAAGCFGPVIDGVSLTISGG